MKIDIAKLQKRVGTIPDGFWGPKSIAACQAHLRNLMPNPNPFPTYSERIKFYGTPGNVEIVRVKLPEKLALYGDNKMLDTIGTHIKCAESLERIMWDIYARGYWDLIKSYDGCYNNRSIRGGNAISNHAWACAIDLNASTNGNRTAWPVRADMPIEIMECFAREGWYSAGAFWSRDAMHHEAVQP